MKHLNWSKRLVAGLLAVVLILSVLPTALAEETEQTQAQCTCAPVEGVHDAACPLYEAPGAEEGTTMPSEEADSAEETENSAAESEDADPAADPAENNDATEAGDTDSAEQAENDGSTEQTESTETIASETPALFSTTRATGPTITAALYADANKTTKLADLTAHTTAEGSGTFTWKFVDGEGLDTSAVVYLFIECDNLNSLVTSTITLEMDQIVYILSCVEDWKLSAYNTSLKVNKTGSYRGGQWSTLSTNTKKQSGTYVFTSTGAEQLTLEPIQLQFDPILWNRQKNAELKMDDTKPLLKVTLKSEDTTTALSVKDAIAGNNHMYYQRRYVRLDVLHNGSSTNYTEVRYRNVAEAGSTKDIIRYWIRGYNFSSGDYTPFYSKEFVIKLTLPKGEVNGVERTMKVVKLHLQTPTVGSYEYSYDETNGIVTVTLHDVLGTANVMGYIDLQFPELSNLEQGATYLFVGDERYYNDGVEVKCTDNKNYLHVQLNNESGSKLECLTLTYGVDDTVVDGVIGYLGFYALKNSGNDASDPVTVKMTFNEDDSPVLGVTAVNLMADAKQNPMVVTYTLMDESGNPVNNGESYTISLSHNYTTATKGMYVTLNRTALPQEQQQYYFKTIEYTLTEIPGRFQYNNHAANHLTPTNPGVFFGRSLVSGTATSGQTLIEVFSNDAEKTELTALERTIITPVKTSRTASFQCETIAVSTPYNAAEIYAGDTWGLTVTAGWTEFTYSNSTYIDGVRFAFCLPVGMVINESTIKAWFPGGSQIPTEKIICTHKTVETEDRGEEILWIIELPTGYPIGFYNENLKKLPNGTKVSLSFQVNTSRSLQDDVLKFSERVFVAAKGYDCWSSFGTADIYDINEIKGTTDYVGALSTAASLKVNKIGDMLQENNDLTVADGEAQSSVVLAGPDQQIAYSLDINNEAGGQASDLAYYIEIPQESFAGATSLTEKIVLSGPGTVNRTSGTELTLLYTTDSGLTALNAKEKDENDEITWKESPDDYSAVTMVKVVIKNSGEIFVNGSTSEIVLPLAYQGTEFSKVAGSSVDMNASASFVYIQGMAQATIFRETEMLTISTHYTHPVHEITLTAALNGEPKGDGNVKEAAYATGLSFYNPHDFKIQNVSVYNVDLGDYTAEQLNADANQRFKITAQMNPTTGTTVPVVQGKTFAQLAAGTELSFLFELFNGNALTDITTGRHVTFEIASDSVTIPVRIIINRELATVGDIATGIKAGKEYINAGNAQNVSISRDSAFTAQFVITGFNSTNYGAHKLKFSASLPAGTTIAMMDYTVAASPRYAHFRVDSSVSEIDLTQFTLMGTTTGYTLNTQDNIDEKLLFVVDFSNATGSYLPTGEYTISLNVASKAAGVEAVTSTLKFTTTGERAFTISGTPTTLIYGNKFTLGYGVTSASNDSKYNGRMVTVVVSGDNLPADAYLVSQSGNYYQNTEGQFVIPLTAAQVGTSEAGSIDLELRSAMLENSQTNCELTATLWISATASADKPFMGTAVKSVTVKYEAVTLPSLKVTVMSDRALTAQDLTSNIAFTYSTANVPADGYVTLEIQKQVDAGYVPDSIYLENVEGSSAVVQGVYTVPSGGATLNLRFSTSLGIGNYQVMMYVRDADGNELLEVPYRFIVTE